MTKADQETDISKLPNIGKTLADKLKLIGIKSAFDLRSVGSENVFIKLQAIDKDACINMLYAIEGAIQGIRWHGLDRSKKEELKEFFNQTKK